MRELFIYYRVRAGTTRAAREAVVAMQRELATMHEGLEARLLMRADAATGDATWMEIYAARRGLVDGGEETVLDDRLEAEIANRALALAPFIEGARHVERFEAAPPAAPL